MTEMIKFTFGPNLLQTLLLIITTGVLVGLAPRTTTRYAVAIYACLVLIVLYAITDPGFRASTIIIMLFAQIIAERTGRNAGWPEWAGKLLKLWNEQETEQTNQTGAQTNTMTPTQINECLDLRHPDVYELRLEVTPSGDQILTCPCCDGSGEHSNLMGNNPAAVLYPCGTCTGNGEIELNLTHTKN